MKNLALIFLGCQTDNSSSLLDLLSSNGFIGTNSFKKGNKFSATFQKDGTFKYTDEDDIAESEDEKSSNSNRRPLDNSVRIFLKLYLFPSIIKNI